MEREVKVMKRVFAGEVPGFVGKKVRVAGFVHEVRDQAKVKFVLLRDKSGIVQVVATPQSPAFSAIAKTARESVISVVGTVKKEAQAPGGFEVHVESFEVLSVAKPGLPIQVVEKQGETGLAKRLDYRWLDLRKPQNALIFKVWTTMEEAMREWWKKEGYTQIHSPKFMGAPSESGAELFSVPYFGKTAFLAQSPQFYKQMAMSAGFEKVFEIGPVFRANPSHTSRHDTEFTSIDLEISYVDSHEDVMAAEEAWLAHTLGRVKKTWGKEIEKTFGAKIVVPKVPFPRMTMKDAQERLEKEGYRAPEKGDLDPEGEKRLGEIVARECNHAFVFVTEYPVGVRPFYHMRKEGDSTLTKSYDLLWKGMEITTGAQREHRYEILKKQAKEKGLNLEPIEDYLNFFRYGCPPHGGFGLSPTRMLMLMLGIPNVREVTFLPRDTDRLRP